LTCDGVAAVGCPSRGGTAAIHVLEISMGLLERGVRGERVQRPQDDREHPLSWMRRTCGLPSTDTMSRVCSQWLAREDQRLAGPKQGTGREPSEWYR
jgi:hypothetical protein